MTRINGIVHIRHAYFLHIRDLILRQCVFQPGPPAPPDPVLYYRQFAVAPSNVQHEAQREPAFFSK